MVKAAGSIAALYPPATPNAQNPLYCGAYRAGSAANASRFACEAKWKVDPLNSALCAEAPRTGLLSLK
jgi:hypothetical protein